MSTFNNLDSDANWSDARQPHKNKFVMGCAIFNSVVWAVLFGVFVYNTDAACTEGELTQFTSVAFWLFVTCAILEVVIMISILVNKSTNSETNFWSIFNCLLLFADVGLGLFIFIRGIVVTVHSDAEIGCESLYYLLLVYVIIVSVLLGLFIISLIVISCCYVCCALINKDK